MTPVVARPSRLAFGLCVAVALLGVACAVAMALDAPRPGAAVLIGALIVGPAGLGIAACGRIAWIADDDGLHWRGLFGGWKSVRWDQIAAFGIRRHPSDSRHDRAEVRLADGRTLAIDRGHDGFAYLSAALSERVPPLPDATVMAGGSAASLWTLRLLSPLVVGGPAWLAVEAAARVARAQANGTFGWWTWGSMLMASLVFLPMLAAWGWMTYVAWTETPQRVIVDDAGFTVEQNGAARRWAWGDFRAVRRDARGLTAVTGEGDVRLSIHLSHYRRVLVELARRAPAPEASAPEPSAGGVRPFGYACREYRAVLSLPLALGVACVAGGGMRPHPTPFVVGAVLIGLALWGLWRMRASRVEIDADGVTFVDLQGRRRLRWSDIDDYGVSGSEMLTWGWVDGRGQRHRFWAGIEGSDALAREISRRVPTAPTGWPSGKWDRMREQ